MSRGFDVCLTIIFSFVAEILVFYIFYVLMYLQLIELK